MEKPTKIQRTIEYNVTNGAGYHERRDFTKYFASRVSENELTVYLLALEAGMGWYPIPSSIRVNTTRPDRAISYFGEQPGLEPIYDLGSGLGIVHPTREQREALIQEGRRLILEGARSRRPAEITNLIKKEDLQKD